MVWRIGGSMVSCRSARAACANNRTARLRLRVAATAALAVALAGCAAGARPRFVDRPGVPVTVTTVGGERFSGRLVSFERGVLLVDRAIPRSDELVVMREGERNVAYIRGTAAGEAVEIRGFDVVVRQAFREDALAKTEVATRAYFGWGTAIAAVLSFFMVRIIVAES
jgi:hypothetical protein